MTCLIVPSLPAASIPWKTSSSDQRSCAYSISCSSASHWVPRRRRSAASPLFIFSPRVSPGSTPFSRKPLPLVTRNGSTNFRTRSRISLRGMVKCPPEASLPERGVATRPDAAGGAGDTGIANRPALRGRVAVVSVAARGVEPSLARKDERQTLRKLASSQGPGLPEVVVDAVRREQAAERHLHALADGHRRRVDVRQLALKATAALEVDHRGEHRRGEGVGLAIDGVRRDGRRHVGLALRGHSIYSVALDAHPLRRHVARPAGLAAAAHEGELPALGAERGRPGR